VGFSMGLDFLKLLAVLFDQPYAMLPDLGGRGIASFVQRPFLVQGVDLIGNQRHPLGMDRMILEAMALPFALAVEEDRGAADHVLFRFRLSHAAAGLKALDMRDPLPGLRGIRLEVHNMVVHLTSLISCGLVADQAEHRRR